MKIIGLSDLHGDLVNINPCDVVCIAGDIMPLKIQRNIAKSLQWLEEVFIPWASVIPCKHVILVGGNHDFVFDPDYNEHLEQHLKIFEDTNIIYLNKSSIEIDGKVFYGDPTCTGPAGWAFYKPDENTLFNDIPNCDVLITHQPPRGNVGTVYEKCWNYLTNFGSIALENRLLNGGIKHNLCGHIHSGLHAGECIGECVSYNVSIKDEGYNVAFWPLELEI